MGKFIIAINDESAMVDAQTYRVAHGQVTPPNWADASINTSAANVASVPYAVVATAIDADYVYVAINSTPDLTDTDTVICGEFGNV